MSKVTVYATHSCSFCHALISWLEQSQVDHEVKFIDSNGQALSQLNNLLQGSVPGVPITVIEGSSSPIIGFDRQGIATELQKIGINISTD